MNYDEMTPLQTTPSYLIGSTEQVSDNIQELEQLELDERDIRSMEETYAGELHEAFTRKNGLCDFCQKPIGDISQAEIFHMHTRYGFRPILIHASEYLAASLENAGAHGLLGMGWSKKKVTS